MIILKELESYSENKLMKEFNCDSNDLKEILKILDDKKITRANLKNEIQFCYVGIAIVKDKPIFVLPKYVNCNNEQEEKLELKNIIKLLNEFSEREKLDISDVENIAFEQETLENNLISITSYLLDDYIENGIYQNEIDSTEFNGDGDINWDRTIDQIHPIVINKQWFYADLITNRIIIDNDRFITMLHGKVINECMEFLNNTGLNEFLNYEIEVIENTIEDLEDIDRIESEIDKEVSIQFNDRKRRVLYSIKSYLDKKTGTSDSKLLLYGTRNFKWIWEVICGYVFDNEFIRQGSLSKYEVYGIEAPKWYIDNKNSIEINDKNDIEMQKNRLTPDILKLVTNDQLRCLLILDAKYYNIRLNGNRLQGNPGVEDITKQYLYHSALTKYINDNKINQVINAFLFPTQNNTYVQGEVNLDFMRMYSNIDIKLIQLNVNEVIRMYCNNKKYKLEEFILMVSSWHRVENNKRI
ncbi:LlaJI family restriction endonuclease [Clostridium butyricum]|uniref:LlaJI family restriction endonuclease n=1 Tax=Clostridium butyricum TaxID=1492 RepID=UPI00346752E5